MVIYCVQTVRSTLRHADIVFVDDVNPIIDAAVGMPHFKKSKYTILSCLAQSNLCSRLVTKDASGLAKELFEAGEDSALASQVKVSRATYFLLM